MNQVITTFCLTLLHSLWQGALLYVVYRAFVHAFMRKGHPVEKRNLLFLLMCSQMLMSAATFIILQLNLPATEITLLTEVSALAEVSPSLTNLLFMAYLLIVAYKSMGICRQWRSFRGLTKNRISAPVELRLFVNVKRMEMGISKKIEVWLNNNLTTPLTYGCWKPVILLPAALVSQLSTEEVETLILHELAHISSKDYMLNFLLLSSEIIFFFNPFIRLLANEVKSEREKNCDLRVIQFKYPPLLYAGTLLKTARFQNAVPRIALAAVSEKSALMERIKLITGKNEPRTAKSPNPGTYAFLFLMIMVLGLFGVSSMKQRDSVLLSNLSESYAPNEVFSFVKEASLDEGKTVETRRVESPSQNHKICAATKEKNCAPVKEKRNLPARSFVSAEPANTPRDNYFTIPVSSKELIEKEVEITEEDPETGIITTTGIKMTWTDSGWVTTPLWQTSLKKAQAGDSSRKDQSGPVPFYEAQ